MKKHAEIGIIGGSGFYSLVDNLKEIKVETPYGFVSEKIGLGKIGRHQIAFLPRHNKTHDLPPHQINYRANIWALHSLGVKEIITVTACGSLQQRIKPGDFIVLDQFVDRTRNRQDTFFNGPITTHISAVNPYCKRLNKYIYNTGKKLGLKIHKKGTVVVINGPRFSTLAESEWFTRMGWDVVNMTQYPEVILCRELEICYSAVAIVTDWDAGLAALEKVKPVSTKIMLEVYKKNMQKVKKLILSLINKWPQGKGCECQKSLAGARI